MPICRPVPVPLSSTLWTEVCSSDYCQLQKYTILWASSYRVVTKYTAYVLAEADSLEAIENDWSRVHRVIAEDVPPSRAREPFATLFSRDGVLRPQDAVVVLLAHMHCVWSRSAAGLPHALAFDSNAARAAAKDALQPQLPLLPADSAPPAPTTAAPPVPSCPAPGVPQMLPPPPTKRAPAPLLSESDMKVLVDETRLWESRRERFFDGVKSVFERHRERLRGELDGYLGELREVGRAQGFDEALLRRMEDEERTSFAEMSRMMFGERSACVRVVEEEISKRRKAFSIVNDVIRIQKMVRGWLARKRFRGILKQLRHRRKVAKEMLSTERSYVEAMELMVNEFRTPLRQITESERAFVSHDDVSAIFSNIEVILSVSKEMLSMLEDKLKNWDSTKTCIGEAICKMAPFLKSYKQYVTNYDTSIAVLGRCLDNSDFKQWHEATYGRQAKKLPLEGYLIMPVQRVPRYALLLKDIVANTPENHPDYARLLEAKKKIQEIASDINEAKRRMDSQKKIVELQELLGEQIPDLLQPHRVFIKEGLVIREIEDATLQPCNVILFNDLLLVTQKKRGFDGKHYLVLLESISLGACSVAAFVTERDTKFKHGFAVKSRKATHKFLLEKKAERDEWTSELEDIVEKLKAGLKSLRITPSTDSEVSASEAVVTAKTTISEASGSNLTVTPPVGSTSPALSTLTVTNPSQTHRRVMSVSQTKKNLTVTKQQAQQLLEHAKVKDVLKLYTEVNDLQMEIMAMPIELKSLMPQFVQSLHPDLQQRLKARLDLLTVKLIAMDQLHTRAMTLLRDEGLFKYLDTSIQGGLIHLDGLRKWITAYTKEMQAQAARAGVPVPPQYLEPARLIRPLLSWYLDLAQAWELVSESDVEAEIQ